MLAQCCADYCGNTLSSTHWVDLGEIRGLVSVAGSSVGYFGDPCFLVVFSVTMVLQWAYSVDTGLPAFCLRVGAFGGQRAHCKIGKSIGSL